MRKARDTKGDSLLTLAWIDRADYEDLCEIARALERYAPGSKAAVRTRRVVALAETALAEAQEGNLRDLWAALAYQEENNWPWEENVPARLAEEEFVPLAGRGGRAEGWSSRLVGRAERLLRWSERVRNAVHVRRQK